jgi:HK97 family phage portal protein
MLDNFRKQLNSLISRKSLDSITGFMPFNLNDYKSRWGKNNFLNAYEISIYAHKTIEKRAEKVGEINFELFRNGKPVDNNEIVRVLENPNSVFTGEEFWSLWSRSIDIYGEAYIVIDGNKSLTKGNVIKELHHLNPANCKPFFDNWGTLTKVEYQKNGGDTTTYEGEKIIYTWRPDPANPLRGMSLLKSGVRAIETGIQIDEYHSRILQNGGKIEGVFKFKQKLTPEQRAALMEQYDEKYATAKKSGRPLFLEGDADYQKVGLTPTEMSYLETKNVTLEDILMLTGVPKVILGSFEGIKYDNADAAIRVFLRETIKPILRGLTAKLDARLFPQEDYLLSFVDPTPEDRDQVIKENESGIRNYYMTPNEARERVGLEPIKGGDELLIPFNLTGGSSVSETTPAKTMTKAVKSPACRQDDESTKDCVERKIPELISEEGMSQEQAIAVANELCAVSCNDKNKKKWEHPLKNEKSRRIYEKLSVARLANAEEKMRRIVDKYFKDQSKRIEANLENQKSAKTKALVDEVFNMSIEVQLAKETFLPMLEDILKDAGLNAQDITGDIDFKVTSEMQSWLENKNAIFSQQINDTTFKKLQSEFAESFAEGETRVQLVDRVQNTYGDITRARAETIARTETHGVLQYGTLKAYEQAMLPTKVWVTVGDSKVRASHQSLDGEEVPTKEYFSNGLKFPSDPDGPASETINCRCVI